MTDISAIGPKELSPVHTPLKPASKPVQFKPVSDHITRWFTKAGFKIDFVHLHEGDLV